MINLVRPHLAAGDLAALKQEVMSCHVEDIASALPSLSPTEQALVFRVLTKSAALDVFELLTPDQQATLVEAMSMPDAVDVIEQLDADDAIHLLDELPARVAKRLVAELDDATRESVQSMLGYPPGTVGRMLSPHYLWVRWSATVAEAREAVRDSQLRSEHLNTVFVVDDERRYQGLIRLGDLIRADLTWPVSDLVEARGVTASATDDAGAAGRLLQRRNLDALPVLDSEGRLIGAVTVDDAMDAIDQDTSATMYGIAGIADPGQDNETLRSEKLTSGPISYPVRVRLAFLMVTLAGGIAVGGLIDAFEDTLAAVVALAIFIPLVMDMGGNVGTQSTTIFARGLALGHIDLSKIWRHIGREMRVGLVMGLIIGVVGGSVAYLWQGAPNGIPALGLAVGISLFVSVNIATFLGFFLPWFLIKLGLDHAPGADPFITTIKDFTGLFVYFGLAAWVLNIV